MEWTSSIYDENTLKIVRKLEGYEVSAHFVMIDSTLSQNSIYQIYQHRVGFARDQRLFNPSIADFKGPLGIYHRTDGPAYCMTRQGIKLTDKYYTHGLYHREDGPAVIVYDEDGSVWSEQHMFEGREHCETGPSYRSWSRRTKTRAESYSINGQPMTVSEYRLWCLARNKEEGLTATFRAVHRE